MFSRFVSKISYSLKNIISFSKKHETLVFEYKNGKTIDVDVIFNLHNSLCKESFVDCELFTISKIYPPFQAPSHRSTSMKKIPSKIQESGEKEEETRIKSHSMKNVPTKKKQPKKQSVIKKKWKFPLMDE